MLSQKLSGDIVINGQPVASSTLRKVVAYVRNDTALCPAMSVEHTLRFHAALRKPRNTHSHVKMGDRDRVSNVFPTSLKLTTKYTHIFRGAHNLSLSERLDLM